MAGVPEKRILIVEDEAVSRTMLASHLRDKGLTVDEADGGRLAIDLLGANHYAVVVVDLVMAQPDGFAVLEALSTRAVRKPTVVLVTTGAEPAVLDRLDPERIHGVVKKPFDTEELADLVLACSEIRSRSPVAE